MAEIATYQCTNNRCRLAIRLSRDFPVWQPGTPAAMRNLSPSRDTKQFIERYRTEIFCHSCRKVSDHNGTLICAACGAQDLREEQGGKSCAQCPIGTFEMTKLIVY